MSRALQAVFSLVEPPSSVGSLRQSVVRPLVNDIKSLAAQTLLKSFARKLKASQFDLSAVERIVVKIWSLVEANVSLVLVSA